MFKVNLGDYKEGKFGTEVLRAKTPEGLRKKARVHFETNFPKRWNGSSEDEKRALHDALKVLMTEG